MAGNPKTHPLPAVTVLANDLIVSGSLARTDIPSLLRQWPPTGVVHVETQSGSFFGSLSTPAQWTQLRTWVEAASGNVQLLQDRRGLVSRHPSPDPLWEAIKKQYDPDHCLADLG
jgi:hypothetical protein